MQSEHIKNFVMIRENTPRFFSDLPITNPMSTLFLDCETSTISVFP